MDPDLLLAQEFAEIPSVVRTNRGDIYLKESTGAIAQPSTEENGQRLADLSNSISPGDCWVVADRGSQLWRTTGSAPHEYISVTTQYGNVSFLFETAYRFDESATADQVLRHVTNALETCHGYELVDGDVTYPVSVADRTSEIDLPSTIAYSNSRGEWRAVSVSGGLLLTVLLENESEIDASTWITRAVEKFQANAKP